MTSATVSHARPDGVSAPHTRVTIVQGELEEIAKEVTGELVAAS